MNALNAVNSIVNTAQNAVSVVASATATVGQGVQVGAVKAGVLTAFLTTADAFSPAIARKADVLLDQFNSLIAQARSNELADVGFQFLEDYFVDGNVDAEDVSKLLARLRSFAAPKI